MRVRVVRLLALGAVPMAKDCVENVIKQRVLYMRVRVMRLLALGAVPMAKDCVENVIK